jgi:murein DD-endopeptidase MepM/ murein hydrolase activator NlpD
VGDVVHPGDVLGYIADDDEDGGAWGPHLHFGIRRGRFDPDATRCGVWLYVGYTRSCPETSHDAQREEWYDPTDFLIDQGATRPAPGGELAGPSGVRAEPRLY